MQYLVLRCLKGLSWHNFTAFNCIIAWLSQTQQNSLVCILYFKPKLSGWDVADCHDLAHWNKQQHGRGFFYYQSINQSWIFRMACIYVF